LASVEKDFSHALLGNTPYMQGMQRTSFNEGVVAMRGMLLV
jgi:hypothetical protein